MFRYLVIKVHLRESVETFKYILKKETPWKQATSRDKVYKENLRRIYDKIFVIFIEKDVSPNHVFSILFCFSTVVCIVIYALLFFTTTKQKLSITFLIYRYMKRLKAGRRREERKRERQRILEPCKKVMVSVTSA